MNNKLVFVIGLSLFLILSGCLSNNNSTGAGLSPVTQIVGQPIIIEEVVTQSVASCNDGIQNQDETDIDCGGTCPACESGQSCVVDSDCQSGYCDEVTNTCQKRVDQIILKNNKGYPFNSNDPGPFDWSVWFEFGSDLNTGCDNNSLCSITIFNDGQRWDNTPLPNDPLYVPSQALTSTGQAGTDTATFLYNIDPSFPGKDFFHYKWLGFETDEPVTKMRFNATGIRFSDTNDRLHAIPYFLVLAKDTSGSSFTFDRKTIYYKADYSVDFEQDFDGNITFAKSPINNSTSESDIIARNVLYQDGAVSFKIKLPGQDDYPVIYRLFGDDGGVSGDLYLLLEEQTLDVRFDADIKFFGTDTTEDGTIDKLHYWPDHVDFGGGINSFEYYIARFGVETGGDYFEGAEPTPDFDTTVFIDTGTHKLPNFPNPNLSYYTAAVWYNLNAVDGPVKFGMDEDPNTLIQPQRAYNDYGSRFDIDNGDFYVFVPDRARRGVFQVATTNASKTFKTGETTGSNNFNSSIFRELEFNFRLTDSSLSNLMNIQTEIRVDGMTYLRGFREEIAGQSDVLFDYRGDAGAADLEGTISLGDMSYTVNLGLGIPREFVDGANDHIRIPFFGQNDWVVVSTGVDAVDGIYTVVLERLAVCGNGVIEGTEQCEGSDFGGLTCGDFGFTSGSLTCTSCSISASACFNDSRTCFSDDYELFIKEDPTFGRTIIKHIIFSGTSWTLQLDDVLADGTAIVRAQENLDVNNYVIHTIPLGETSTIEGFTITNLNATRSPDSIERTALVHVILKCSFCGNRVIEGTEQCDDGNNDNGDGCSSSCQLEVLQKESPAVEKNRYISFVSRNTGKLTALRVKLDSLYHPVVVPSNSPDFSGLEGQYRWVGPPKSVSETASKSDSSTPTFVGAQLQCEPYYADWGEQGLVHVFGSEVIPSSSYDVQAIEQECSTQNEECYSNTLTIKTSLLGDIVGKDDPNFLEGVPNGKVDIKDILAIITKFRNLDHASIKARVDMAPTVPNQIINISDILVAILGIRRLGYQFNITNTCTPSTSTKATQEPKSLSEEEAGELAQQYFNCPNAPYTVDIELNNLDPVWKVDIDQKIVHVTTTGQVTETTQTGTTPKCSQTIPEEEEDDD